MKRILIFLALACSLAAQTIAPTAGVYSLTPGSGGGGGSGTVSSGTVNTMAKYTAATTVGDSLLTDDGALLTYTGISGLAVPASIDTASTTFALINDTATTINFAAAATTLNIGNASGTTNLLGGLSLNPSGTVSGSISFKEGTAPSAAAANNVQIYAPADVTTAYDVILPASSSTGVVIGTNSSNVNTLSFVAPGSSGNVLTSNGTTWTSAAASGGGGMMIPMYSTSFNWADGAVYYCGATPTNTTTFTATDVQSTSPITGTVTAFSVNFRYVAGSNENVSIVIRNVTTATNSGALTVQLSAGTQATGVVSGLSLAVTAGDQLVAQVTCPTWATNPTAINTSVFCYIQQ